MPNKESPQSPAETPQAAEPRKPILLGTVAQDPRIANPDMPSADDELPVADDADVFELTEEVGENENIENQLRAAEAEIAALNKAAKGGEIEPSPIPTAALPIESGSNILGMIQEVTEPQPGQHEATQRTLTPAETPKMEKSALELLREGRERLDKEIFNIGGKVRDESSLKIVGGDLLAIMEISKKTKNVKNLSDEFLKLTSPDPSLPSAQTMGGNDNRKIEDPESALVYAQGFRDGIYLVLRSTITDEETLSRLEILNYLNEELPEGQGAEKIQLSVLGGRHAEKLKPEKVEELYKKINSAADFLTLSQKIEDAAEKKKAEGGKNEFQDKTGTDQ